MILRISVVCAGGVMSLASADEVILLYDENIILK